MGLMASVELGRVALVIVAGTALFWVVLAGIVAEYGRAKGFPWFPLSVSALFVSWPLVLLAVVVGAGPTRNVS